MKKTAIILLLALAGSFSQAYAQEKTIAVVRDQAGWQKIGETTVNFQTEWEEIVFTGKDKFTALQFRVNSEPIELLQMEVYYDNGDKQPLTISETLKFPGETRVLDLNGGDRIITKVAFEYKTLPNWKDKPAHITLWGLKTN